MKDPADCSHPVELQSTSVWNTAVPPEHPGYSRITRTICRGCGLVLKDERTGPFVESDGAPPPPVDVRLVLYDGTEVPVECVYVGMQGRTRCWTVLHGPPVEQISEMRIGMLPGQTEITISEGYTGE